MNLESVGKSNYSREHGVIECEDSLVSRNYALVYLFVLPVSF